MKILQNLPIINEEKPNKPKETIKLSLIKDKPKKVEEVPLQLDLGLKESPINKLFAVRHKLDKFEDRIKISQYSKNPILWIMIFVPLIITIYLYYKYSQVQDRLPEFVPMIWITGSDTPILISKYWLMVLSSVSFVLSVSLIILVRFAYTKIEKIIPVFAAFITITSLVTYESVMRIIKIFI
ncbi:MAG: hypothetical protein WCJ19_02355 [bacterium]